MFANVFLNNPCMKRVCLVINNWQIGEELARYVSVATKWPFLPIKLSSTVC